MHHPSPPPQESFSFGELLQTLWKGKAYILFSILSAALLAFIYLKVTTPIYEATAIVYVNTEPNYNEVLSGTATSKGERKLENEVGLLQYSKTLAMEVARRLEEAARQGMTGLTITVDPETGRALTAPEIASRFEDYVEFEPVEGMDMIEIVVESPNPEEAALIANLYAEVYRAYSEEVQRKDIAATRRSLEQQEAQLARKIRDLEAQREEYLRRYNIPAMGENGEHLVNRLSELETQREQTQVDLQQATITLNALKAKLSRLEPEDIAEFSALKSEIDALDERIAELKLQEEDFYAINPQYREAEKKPRELEDLAKRIERYKKRKQELSQRLVSKATASGFNSPEDIENLTLLRQELAEKETEVQTLRTKLQMLDRNIQQIRNQLAVFPERATALAQLEREREAAMQARMEVLRKLHEARMAEEAEKGYVEIVHSATPPSLPAKPHPVQLMVLAIFIGMFIGVGIAILRQNLESAATPAHVPVEPVAPHVPTPETAELPILARIPEISAMPPATTSWQSIQQYTHAGELVLLSDPWSPAAEVFRHLYLHLQQTQGAAPRTLLVTSPATGDGKSFVAANLGVALAQAGKRVIVLDLHTAPENHGQRFFGPPGAAIQGDGIPRRGWEAYRTRITGLYYAPARVLRVNERTPARQLQSLFAQLTQTFDVIILDAPPVSHAFTQHAAAAGATTLLVTTGSSSDPRVRQAADTLARIRASLAGLVLNRQTTVQAPTFAPAANGPLYF